MPRPRIEPMPMIQNPWEALSSAISNMIADKKCEEELSYYFQACTDLVNKEQYEQIFERGLIKMLEDKFTEWHEELRVSAEEQLLSKLSGQYNSFKMYCKTFPTIYMSYDMKFQNEMPNKTLNNISQLFSKIILSDKELLQRSITPLIINDILLAQDDKQNNLPITNNIIQMYYTFNDHSEIFNDFLKKLKTKEIAYYDKFYSDNLSLSFLNYLKNLSEKYKTIQKVLNLILKPNDVQKYLLLFNTTLIQQKENDFLQGSSPKIIDALTSEDHEPMKFLVNIYTSCSESGFQIERLYNTCKDYIKNKMLTMTGPFLDNRGKPKKLLKKEAFELVSELIKTISGLSDSYQFFFESKEADSALNQAIIEAWNDTRFNINENFCKFIDYMIRSRFQGLEQEKQIELIVKYYGYSNDTNLFGLYYNKAFIRRLVDLRSATNEYDKPIIFAIRRNKDPMFLKNYDKFMQFLEGSDNLKTKFKNSLQNQQGVLFEPFVLDALYNDFGNEPENRVDSEANEIIDQFLQFYHKDQPRKEIKLIYYGSKIIFKLNLNNKIYTISTDLPTSLILSSVHQRDFTFADIIHMMNDRKDVARAAMINLTKLRLITSNERAVTDSTVFSFNKNFSNANTNITIPECIAEHSTTDIRQKNTDDMFAATECAIGRVLKEKRRLTLTDLEIKVRAKLGARFNVPIQVIQQSIEKHKNDHWTVSEEDGQTILTFIK